MIESQLCWNFYNSRFCVFIQVIGKVMFFDFFSIATKDRVTTGFYAILIMPIDQIWGGFNRTQQIAILGKSEAELTTLTVFPNSWLTSKCTFSRCFKVDQ